MLQTLVLFIAGERVELRSPPLAISLSTTGPPSTSARSSNPSVGIVATGTATTTTGSSSVSSARLS